jgi:L-amino acid N-acyltransferase YncA
MIITYHLESWSSYYHDPALQTLWREHYNELREAHQERMEMGPDLATYEALDRQGSLVVLTARSAGALVGYCLAVVKRHPHYPTVCGFEDSYYLTPSARRGMAGVRLITRMNKELARRGCKRAYWMSKKFMALERLFLWLKMSEMDTVFCLWLGD